MIHILIPIGPIHTILIYPDRPRPTIVERYVLQRFTLGGVGDATPAKQLDRWVAQNLVLRAYFSTFIRIKII